MIQKNAVYRKSSKGSEAIATRQHGLGPKQRSLLIQVDGKKGFGELDRVGQMLGDTEQLLTQLLEQGFIEPVADAEAAPEAPSTAATASAPAPLAPAAGPPVTLLQAQRFVSRRLTDLLGPNAEELCLRIEGARNVHDFQIAVTRAEGMLRQFVGSNVAAQFAAEAQAHMPEG